VKVTDTDLALSVWFTLA